MEDKLYDANYLDQYDSYEVTIKNKRGNTEVRRGTFLSPSFPNLVQSYYKDSETCELDNYRNSEAFHISCPPLDALISCRLDEKQSSPLFIKGTKSSREKKKGSYGQKGITSYGKKVVKNICVLLEQKYTKHRLGFVTCTLPSMPLASQKLINREWSDVTRRFYQKIKRFLSKKNIDFIYTGVTEIQEKRFKETSIPVPHIHFVYVAKESRKGPWSLDVVRAYKFWNNAVNEVLELHECEAIMGKNGHVGSVKLEKIRKSAGAYLGKYMSKGSKVVKAMKEAGWVDFPKQWWTASMQIKKVLKAAILHLGMKEGRFLFYEPDRLVEEGILISYRMVEVLIEKEMRIVGIAGVLSSYGYRLIKYNGLAQVLR